MLITKQGDLIKSWYQKEFFTLNMFRKTLNMFPKNKQNKLRQTKNNELKEGSYLNYTAITKYAFCFLILLYFIRYSC